MIMTECRALPSIPTSLFLLSLPSRVNFTKLCAPSKKLPAHSVWQKNCHSVSPTFLCHFNSATNWFKFCQIRASFGKRCAPKKILNMCVQKSEGKMLTPGVNFINILQAAFPPVDLP